jgi:UTP--glucose-1-phosphate uridylyltransferase
VGSSDNQTPQQLRERQLVAAASERMNKAGLPQAVISNFEQLFLQVLHGNLGTVTEEEIEPVEQLDHLENLGRMEELHRLGESLLPQLVVIRLNGGLGTTMGLARAKSLLPVKGEYTFNDMIARQLLALRRRCGVSIPLLHMTSFSTDSDVISAMAKYPELAIDGIPSTFLQHKHPKIYADDFTVACEENDELNWNPPGHGDIYAALIASGLAKTLLAHGKRYIFCANADNLGATVDTRILGYLADKKSSFLMETAERTPADSKGGHLARQKGTSRYLLRESGQCPLTESGDLIPEFKDISRHKHFNTNNIWLDLEAVIEVASQHGGCIPLPLISNRKTVNPRDRSSRKVIQLETAMGAAIGVFEGATALQVPRSRFAPVKSNNDLLLVRSDLYIVSEAGHLVVNPDRKIKNLPTVALDSRYFGLISDFEKRIQVVPSLVHAARFEVQGDVAIQHPLSIQGEVLIQNGGESPKVLSSAVVSLKDQKYTAE